MITATHFAGSRVEPMVWALWERAVVIGGSDNVETDTDGMAEPGPALAASRGPPSDGLGVRSISISTSGLEPSTEPGGPGRGMAGRGWPFTSSNI